MRSGDSFETKAHLSAAGRELEIFSLRRLEERGFSLPRLPFSLRVLLENLLRGEGSGAVSREEIEALARWEPARLGGEIAFSPARVLLQDFTGVPALVDLAALRDAIAEWGGEPDRVNPLQPVELVVDHSVQVDAFGSKEAFAVNEEMDYGRNGERYAFLRWGQRAFRTLKLVPPNTGICHQVNLEHLARVVMTSDEMVDGDGPVRAYPDTLVGTDSHTPMVNGIGVLGWGVGGIEAEAAMLGQPISMLIPDVVGVRVTGTLAEGTTATDLVLRVTELLRATGVVGKFVEFHGPGLAGLSVPDRATIANMSPEYGATCTFFPVDDETLRYLRMTGRSEERLQLVEAYTKTQGLFREPEGEEPEFSERISLDLGSLEPSVAGPGRPQDRVRLRDLPAAFRKALPGLLPPEPAPTHKLAADGDLGANRVGVWGEGTPSSPARTHPVELDGVLQHGSVVIAALTSCTNTSNPSVMLAAGLLARNAVRRGLKVPPWVKTSLAPGSKVVTEYYQAAGLLADLERLGFEVVAYGCTTCIGNSGPLPRAVSEEIARGGLVAAAVLSGNRNFEGRINSDVRANYLMSPPLVVAFALAGRIDVDLEREPLARDAQGRPVFLRELWPSAQEVGEMQSFVRAGMFHDVYGALLEGDERWKALPVPGGDRFAWEPESTYVRRPSFLEGLSPEAEPDVSDLRGARVLALLGDSITTDHISPAGSIRKDSPAGRYLISHGVPAEQFNSYGSRRGNHELMVRGTFANVRLRNRLAPGTEGGVTTHLPSGELISIYDAAVRYREEGTPLIVVAGRDYGSGSSRDWAAKGPLLLGIRAVLARSFERIHRSNLVGMGILPLQFEEGASAESIGLTGREAYDLEGLAEACGLPWSADRRVRVWARRDDGTVTRFEARVRIDTPQELLYYRNGGILPFVLRQLFLGREQPDVVSDGRGAGQLRPREERRDYDIEEGSAESFPASDTPSY